MTPERWKQIEDLYHAALEREPAARGAFLTESCGTDGELRSEVESLLAGGSGESPLNRPAWEVAENLLASTVTQLSAGAQLGPYRIEAPLGAGGMGEVFRAVDTRLGRPVAIKVCNEEFSARFEREARAISSLNHPNICTLHDVGATPTGAGFLVMELVQGQTLRARLAQGALPIEQVQRFGVQLADALAHAHAHGIIHRDLKSANIIITPEGRVKLLDFGLAKRVMGVLTEEAAGRTQPSLTAVGAVAGTPAYLAPEQLQGKPADERSDIWALGVVLYEMASGAHPFHGKTVFELVSAILNEAPPPLTSGAGRVAPAWLRSVIERCLKKDPARRYQHSEEVRDALEAMGSGVIPWAGWRYRLARRRWLVLAVVLVVILAVLAGVTGGRLWGPRRAIKLAVLPFANLSGDPQQEYLSDGITQEMIAQLGGLHPGSLSVIARTSVMRYKKSDEPIDQVGRELGVDYILEGSARREGGRIRISAELIQVGDQTQLWAESYDREVAGVLALQSDVARTVARSLALKLLPAEQARLAAVRAVNPEAYDVYLKGLHHWYKITPGDLECAAVL